MLLFLLEISGILRNIEEIYKAGFDKILRNIKAEGRKFHVSYRKKHVLSFILFSFTSHDIVMFLLLFCRIFNTNNLWMKLGAIHRLVKQRALSMEIIVNRKVNLANICPILDVPVSMTSKCVSFADHICWLSFYLCFLLDLALTYPS